MVWVDDDEDKIGYVLRVLMTDSSAMVEYHWKIGIATLEGLRRSMECIETNQDIVCR